MSGLRLHISEAAADDILEQSKWYNQQSGMRLMDRWESASRQHCFESREILVPEHFVHSKDQNSPEHGASRFRGFLNI